MSISVNSLSTNIAVTVMVALFVVILPTADRMICKRLGLNLHGGLSANPQSSRLANLRRLLLLAIFLIYAAANAYLVFFSRTAMLEHMVNANLLSSLLSSVTLDTSVSGIIGAVFSRGLAYGLSMIHIIKPQDIAQIYMNVMLYVPLGYLLPYVFDFFREKPATRPFIAGVLISFLTENLQLVTKRGLYDLDDLLANSLGTWIGQMLFISLAYVVTHPGWRHELASVRRWRSLARRKTLYPYLKNFSSVRASIRASDETSVWDFYIGKLGFRPMHQLLHENDNGTDFLLQIGGTELEIRCSNDPQELLPEQFLTFSARKLDKVRKRLEESGIRVSGFEADPYTHLRKISFMGPDGVRISIIG